MGEGWTFAGEATQSGGDSVTLIERSSFCLSERGGDLVPGTPHGLFHRDTRILSVWQLRLDDEEIDPLSVIAQEPYEALFLGRARPRPGYSEATVLLERRRFVGAGMREDLVLRNLGNEAAACALTLRVEADFADLFEVKEGRVRTRGPGRGASPHAAFSPPCVMTCTEGCSPRCGSSGSPPRSAPGWRR